MIDTITQKPLRVLTYGDDGSDLVVSLDFLDKVELLLDTNGISYEVDDEVLSMDGGPEMAFIPINKKSDTVKVQELLDSVP